MMVWCGVVWCDLCGQSHVCAAVWCAVWCVHGVWVVRSGVLVCGVDMLRCGAVVCSFWCEKCDLCSVLWCGMWCDMCVGYQLDNY